MRVKVLSVEGCPLFGFRCQESWPSISKEKEVDR
jgi:hypothetical protein